MLPFVRFIVLVLYECSMIDTWVVSTFGCYRVTRNIPAPSVSVVSVGWAPRSGIAGLQRIVPTHSAQGSSQPGFQRGCAVYTLASSMEAFRLPCIPVST